MSAPVPLDHDWRAAHPLPAIADGDKYGRGRVLTVGGSRRVPGAIGLTGEAAFRVGAGKVRIATVESAALGLGLAIPEAGMVALPETDEGEIAARGAGLLREQIGSCDTLVFGPAMARTDDIGPLVGEVLAQPRTGLTLVVDAAAMVACVDRPDLLKAHAGRAILTPNRDEMAVLLGCERGEIDADPGRAASTAAARFGSTIVMKDSETFVAAPAGDLVVHESPCVGLGTAGSGDVLAGLIGGLLARGASAFAAGAWGVWLHGQAGAAASRRHGAIGYLARELLAEVPRLVADNSAHPHRFARP